MIGKKAPELSSNEWLNVDKPLSLKDLNGYIVILDFWTYCCINCMHMLRELEVIEQRYSDKPVVVIGVHSAKFYNEREKANIQKAIERYEIKHPVVIDNDMKIWRDYNVNAWPTIVIIDPKGYIVYKQSGEGQKDYIEDVVDVLLEKYKPNREPLKFNVSWERKDLAFPGKLALQDDRIAISDSNNNRILIIDLEGYVKLKIGGRKGFKDGRFEDAMFNKPQGLVWIDNKIYVADTENHALRVIDLDKGMVSTIAGNGEKGFYIYDKEVDPLRISLNSPWDLEYHADSLYIAMAGLHQIWRYDLKLDKIKRFAGNGYEGIVDGYVKEAEFAQPSGLSYYNGKLYVADSESSSIRVIDLDSKIVKSIVGKDLFIFGYIDGKLEEALLQHPIGLDAYKDNIYVADTYNHAIRKIDLKENIIYTLIGKNTNVCKMEGCELLLYEPNDVKYKDDKLYITDTNNHLIRVYDLNSKILTTLELKF